VLGHADPTLNDAAVDGNYAATLKSRAEHTDRVLASQDCVITVYIIDFTGIIRARACRLWSGRRTAAAGITGLLVVPSRPVCWDAAEHSTSRFSSGLRAASGRLLFSLQSPLAYIGPGPFRELVNAYDTEVNPKPVLLVDLFSGQPLVNCRPMH